MNENRYDDLVLEFVSGDAAPERAAEIIRILGEAGYEPDELRELKKTYELMGELPVPEPGEGMTEDFYAMLEDEKARIAMKKSRDLSWLWPKLAYAALFLIIGWSIAFVAPPGGRDDGRIEYMASEMAEMKKMMMFSMLNRSSASERMQAVQYLKELAPEDDQVLMAMLDLFESDPNVNVRLATLDAMAMTSGDERIRESLLRNIGIQDSPLVQLALVDVVVAIGEKRAVEPLTDLLRRKDLNFSVRGRIEEGLRFLS
jgi:hypothetical protein